MIRIGVQGKEALGADWGREAVAVYRSVLGVGDRETDRAVGEWGTDKTNELNTALLAESVRKMMRKQTSGEENDAD